MIKLTTLTENKLRALLDFVNEYGNDSTDATLIIDAIDDILIRSECPSGALDYWDDLEEEGIEYYETTLSEMHPRLREIFRETFEII